MKKKIIILLVCLFSSITSNSQRPTFMGFPLGGQTSYLIQKLRERSFDKADDSTGDVPSEHLYVYKGGTFFGYDAVVFFEEWSGYVKCIMASIYFTKEEASKNVFKKIKQRVIEKYCDYYIIADVDDMFSIEQQTGDDNFMIIVNSEKTDSKYRVSIQYNVRNMPNGGNDDI